MANKFKNDHQSSNNGDMLWMKLIPPNLSLSKINLILKADFALPKDFVFSKICLEWPLVCVSKPYIYMISNIQKTIMSVRNVRVGSRSVWKWARKGAGQLSLS